MKGEEMVCLLCQHDLAKTDSHLHKHTDLHKRFYGRLKLEHALVYLEFKKSGKVQKLLHKLKYDQKPELATLLGRWYGEVLNAHGFGDQFDLLLPIPLHPRKLRQRGYNQSDYFAIAMGEALDLPCNTNILTRVKFSSTQTKKSRIARWQNVEGIFSCERPEELTGKRILLIDDVITTGATLEAAGLELNKTNCESLSIGALAMAST